MPIVGWLIDIDTLSLSSNLLLTNRSMILVLPVLVSPSRMTLKVRLPMVEEVMDILLFKINNCLCQNSNIIIRSGLESSLRLRKTHLCYFGLVRISLRHVLVVLLLEGAHLVVFHCFWCHVLLLQLLSQLVVCLLLLVIELVEIDLDKGIVTFFCTYRLFFSASILIYPSRIDWCLYSSISFVFCRSSIYRSSPFSRFIKAFAYCCACPCMRNILRWSVYFIYLASFYF